MSFAQNHLWWEFLARHHNDPEAVEARRQEANDQARIVCSAVPCPTCLKPVGVPCGTSRGTGGDADFYHFDRGLAYAKTGGQRA